MDKRARTTIESILKALALGIGVFIGMFLFYAVEVSHSSSPMMSNVNNTYGNVSAQMGEINASIRDIRENVFALSESKGIIEKAITSIEGFTATVKLMQNTWTMGLDGLSLLINGTGIPIPAWFMALIFIIVTIIIVFAILKAISGRENI